MTDIDHAKSGPTVRVVPSSFLSAANDGIVDALTNAKNPVIGVAAAKVLVNQQRW